MRNLLLQAILVVTVSTVDATESILSFSQAASNWHATLPIGNGRLGATPFGRTDGESIILNEDSFFSGGFRDRVNSQSLKTFPQVRKLMNDGKLTDAGNVWLQGMVGTPTGERKYEPAGFLNISTGHDQSKSSNYARILDLETGVTSTQYTYDGVTYSREAVASESDQVLAFQFTASKPNSYSLTIKLDRGAGGTATANSDGSLFLRSSGRDDSNFKNSQIAQVSIAGGTITASGSSITVKGATNVTIVWDAESQFYYPDGQTKWEQVLKDRVGAASSKGWASVRATAVANHQKYYKRASFTVAPSPNNATANKPINQRLQDLKKAGSFSQDPELLALGYNYGRYMLIASSRPGSLPANLQGIWNDAYNPPWDAKFTIDINLQMNYWLANMNNLDEILEPVWTHLKRMEACGTAVATKMYGLPGWVCHHNTDLWGDCAPQDAGTQWTIWPMGGPWTLFATLDHYRFTKDKDFAKNQALPVLTSAVQFYNAFSVLENGYYVTGPSNSPENSYFIPNDKSTAGQQTGIDKSPQSDRALMWELYTGFIEISEAAGSTAGVDTAKQYLARLKAPDISSSTGKLLEWSQDFRETEAAHRHFSPAIGLHPGHQYSPLTNKTLAAAAEKFMNARMSAGSGSTGWSRIWAANLYARLLKGNDAVSHAKTLMTDYMYDNMWAVTSDVFQADANYGFTSAVNEMFLQSHNDGLVHIGPAMPSNQLQQGNFKGWKARGNFVVDAAWSEGKIISATVVSNIGGSLALRVQDGRAFKVDGKDYSNPIQTTAGISYKITF